MASDRPSEKGAAIDVDTPPKPSCDVVSGFGSPDCRRTRLHQRSRPQRDHQQDLLLTMGLSAHAASTPMLPHRIVRIEAS